jgi:hypothetical protein
MTRFRWGYTIESGQVLHRRTPIPADPATFEPLSETWSRDRSRVYLGGRPLRGADPTTFTVLSRIAARDRHHVYLIDFGRVRDADASTYEVLTPEIEVDDAELCREYSRDRNHVFHKVLTIGKLSIVRGADPATFRAVASGFGMDATQVFCELQRLPKADPRSWQRLDPVYSKDAARVYHYNKVIEGADAATFGVLPLDRTGWARDARRFYFAGQPSDAEGYFGSPATSRSSSVPSVKPSRSIGQGASSVPIRPVTPTMWVAA